MDISGVNQSSQKERNLSLLLHLIWGGSEHDEYSRVRLAQETGLTQAAVGKLTSELIEWGIVKEFAGSGSGVGRRPTGLTINANRFRCLSIRINRDYISAGIFDISGKQYDGKYYAISPLEGSRNSMYRMNTLVAELMKSADIAPMCIAVAVPGPYNYITGHISLMSGFPGWNEIDIRKELGDRFHMPVFVEQDANCGALAEARSNRYHNGCNMLYVAADRGIGAGIIINGELYRGNLGFAGEIGHASINAHGPKCECGNVGCLELYGSTVAMQNSYIQTVGKDYVIGAPISEITSQQILQMAKEGDPIAAKVYVETVTYLAFGIVSMINAFNPKYVIFADKITFADNLFLPTVKETLRKHLMKEVYDSLIIRTSNIAGDPMLFGTSVVAFDAMLRTPSLYFSKQN